MTRILLGKGARPWQPGPLVAGSVMALVLIWGSTARAQEDSAPGYRAEVVVDGVPYAVDAIEPFRGVLVVSAGAPSPGGRLLRFALPRDTSAPLRGRSGDALLSSRWRLGPIVTYHLTGRIYVGVPDRGQILQLPQVTLDLATLARWEPDPLIVGLAAVHDFTFGRDGRLFVADGSHVLETPVYFKPPIDAVQLRVIHTCGGDCLGVAVADNGDVLVLEADGRAGRVVRRDAGGAIGAVAAGLRRPGEGLRVNARGELFFTAQQGLFEITRSGGVIRIFSGVASPARVNLDADGHPLVTDRDGGKVIRVTGPE